MNRIIKSIPNTITLLNLSCGVFSIILALRGEVYEAGIAITIAAVFDFLDGFAARALKAYSDMGKELDSLADMVSFGVAPGVVMYIWAFESLGKLGLFAAFVHTAGGALRLARFNTQVEVADRRYFQGLPSPAAAAILAGALWISVELDYDVESIKYLILILTISTGLLMVSNFRYSSFKEIDFKGRVPFMVAIIVMLGIGFVMAQAEKMLFLLALSYAISGPVITLLALRKKRRNRKN